MEKIRIRKFEKHDIEKKIEWINNPENNKYLHYDLPLEYDKTLYWYETIKNSTKRYDAVIECNNIKVGLIGLLNIDYKNMKAEYYIAMGECEYKGKGIAKIATKQILEYAFSKLNLNKIYLYTETDNIVAQKLFEKIGFKKEGTLKEDLIIKEKKKDRYLYAIFRKEWMEQIEL